MWFWVGRALNGLMFLYGLYCWETRLLFWICCLSIAIKPWNSCIFKWPSRLVNKPWMLGGLDWSRNKRGCEHRAHLSACLGSVIECCIIVMFSITTQRLESLFLKEWKIDFFHLISELAGICATGKHACLVPRIDILSIKIKSVSDRCRALCVRICGILRPSWYEWKC